MYRLTDGDWQRKRFVCENAPYFVDIYCIYVNNTMNKSNVKKNMQIKQRKPNKSVIYTRIRDKLGNDRAWHSADWRGRGTKMVYPYIAIYVLWLVEKCLIGKRRVENHRRDTCDGSSHAASTISYTKIVREMRALYTVLGAHGLAMGYNTKHLPTEIGR